jgi:hypothetical protein
MIICTYTSHHGYKPPEKRTTNNMGKNRLETGQKIYAPCNQKSSQYYTGMTKDNKGSSSSTPS